jgi:hypothetical protein
VTEPNKIGLIIDGIDDTYIDIWYPVGEQYPVPGDSYEIAFEPTQGYVMAETISVIIDDTEYVCIPMDMCQRERLFPLTIRDGIF